MRHLSVCIVLLLCGPAAAQRPPVNPIDPSYLRVDFVASGARPAALGQAFIGASQDETAAAINPAGLTYLTSAGASLHQRQARTPFQAPISENSSQTFHDTNLNQTMVTTFLPLKWITLALFHQVSVDTRMEFETRQFLTSEFSPGERQVLGGRGNQPGRRVVLDIEMVNDGFSFAFRLRKALSLGLTFKTVTLNYNLNEHLFLDPAAIDGRPPRANSVESAYSITTVDDKTIRPAFNIGLMAELLTDRLFVGGVYHYNPRFKLRSATFLPEFSAGSRKLAAEFLPDREFAFSAPDRAGIGLYYIHRNRLRFTFDLVRIRYSEILSGNSTNVAADDVFDPSTNTYSDPDGRPDLAVDDVTEVHFGTEYVLRVPALGLMPFRLGAYLNPGHAVHAARKDRDLQLRYARQPDRLHVTFGAGLVLNNRLKFDASLDLAKDSYEILGSVLLSIPYE